MIDLGNAVRMGRTAIEQAEAKFDHYDRNAYGNASEIGGCIRKQWYARNLKDQPEQDWGYARRGTHAERYVIESLKAANVMVDGVGDEQFSIQDDDLKLSATPDGLVFDTHAEEWIGMEVKSIDPRTNVDRLPKADHVTQLDIGMGLINKHMPQYNLKRGVVLYIDASNFNILHQFEVKHDVRVLDRMSKRAKRLLRARSAEPLDREGIKTNQCRYCPFKETCGVTTEQPINQVTRANRGSSLHGSVGMYWAAKAEEERAKERKDAAKAEIMAEMEKRGATTLPVGEFVVTLKNVAGRTTYDTKKAEASGVDLSAYKKVGKPSVRLEVERAA